MLMLRHAPMAAGWSFRNGRFGILERKACLNIVDTFMVGDADEVELLLVKLHLENKFVNAWVIVEHAYNFRQKPKGLFLRRILDSDPRFAEFLSKIILIEMKEPFKDISLDYRPAWMLDDEAVMFSREYQQRQSGFSYIAENFPEDTWVMVTDVDESVDFSSDIRAQILINCLQQIGGNPFNVPRIRHWYDFDNRSNAEFYVPFQTIKYIKESGRSLPLLRSRGHSLGLQREVDLCFEYSFCFGKPAIYQKLQSFSHTGFDSYIDVAIECNHWLYRPADGDAETYLCSNPTLRLFEKIIPMRHNSPQYVRENIDRLRTGNIPVNYRENRRARYPKLAALYPFQ